MHEPYAFHTTLSGTTISSYAAMSATATARNRSTERSKKPQLIAFASTLSLALLLNPAFSAVVAIGDQYSI